MLTSTWRAPKNLSLGGVELQTVASHPHCHLVYAHRDLLLELNSCYWRAAAIDLCVVGVQMWTKIMPLDQPYEISCVQQEQYRSEDRSLWDSTQDEDRMWRRTSTADMLNSLDHMGSCSITCHPTQVNVPHLNLSQTGQYSIYLIPTPEGWKAELTWVVGYMLRWFTCGQTVTHPFHVVTGTSIEQLYWSRPTH